MQTDWPRLRAAGYTAHDHIDRAQDHHRDQQLTTHLAICYPTMRSQNN